MTLLLLVLSMVLERAPLWVTFDVLNPRTLGGHRILHLEDVVGPRARDDVPGLVRPRAVLIFSATLDQCGKGTLCQTAQQLAEIKGGLVVGVVLAERENVLKAKREIPRFEYSFPLTVDSHGVLGQALKLDRPGVFLVVNSNAELERLVPPSEGSDRTVQDRFFAQVKSTYLNALKRDEEEER
jgi:hypothetical protein